MRPDILDHEVYVVGEGVRGEPLGLEDGVLRVWPNSELEVLEFDVDRCVGLSEHAQRRWRVRASAENGIGEAWEEASELEVTTERSDRMRYHGPTDTVLVLVNEVVVTVLQGRDHVRRDVREAIDALGA